MAEDPDPNSEPVPEDENSVIIYKAQGGQLVTLSLAALKAYGETYIDQVAASSGKDRLVLADETVLQNAKNDFPDSKTPLIDAYPDFIDDGQDILAVIERSYPDALKSTSEEQKAEYLRTYNKSQDDLIQNQIRDNAPMAIAQPNGNSALIVIPSPSSLEENSFKEQALSLLSGLDGKIFSNVPGSDMDWAKIVIFHEISHLKNKDSERDFNDNIKASAAPSTLLSYKIDKFRSSVSDETKADISALSDFNSASGANSSIPQSYASIRVIAGFMSGGDLIDMGGGYLRRSRESGELETEEKTHNTGNALLDFIENGKTDFNVDREQFTIGYTNTLVNGLIGVSRGEKIIKGENTIDNRQGNPVYSEANSTLNRESFLASRAGNDPSKIVAVGSVLGSGADVYASTKALLDGGQFDHAPDIKRNAERFINAVQNNAPTLIEPDKVDFYREALENPTNQNFMNELHRYYNPDLKIGYLHGGAANPQASGQPTPGPALAQ